MSDIRFNGWLHRSGSGGVYQDSSGRVGIGTSTQNHSLVLYQADSGTHDCISMRNSTTANNGFTLGLSSAEAAFIWNGSNTDMTFATSNTERLRIHSDGDITHTGADNVEYKMKCGSSSGNNILAFLNSGGTTRGNITYDSDNNFLFFNVNQAERLRILSSGSVIAGATALSAGNRSQYSILSAVSNNTSATGHGVFNIQAGANSSSGNEVAQICFSDLQGDYAWIQTFADAATGSSDKPGRLVFSTTADGGTVPTERLRITSAGAWGIAGANYGSSGQVLTSGGSGAAISWTTVSGGVTSDAQTNTVAGTQAGNSFSGTDANGNALFGYQAGEAITTGDYNTAVGRHAALALTTASQNTAMGVAALSVCTTGGLNTAIGSNALQNNTASFNTAVGASALTANTSGGENTAIGYEAGASLTTGQRNTIAGRHAMTTATTSNNSAAFGWEALYSTTTGYQNCAFGDNTLRANTTGNLNTAVGRGALVAATTADGNVAIGAEAGDAITTGHSNTCLGTTSLSSCVTGNYNTALGKQTLQNCTGGENTAVGSACCIALTSGSNNVAMGRECMAAATTGSHNTAIGKGAMAACTTGGSNVAIGYNALKSITTRSTLVAIGEGALQSNTTGYDNCAVGPYALEDLTTGYQNAGFGHHAGRNITDGDYNTAIGRYSMGGTTSGNRNIGIGPYTLWATGTGNDNIGIGYEALSALTSGASNTAIGRDAGKSNTTGTNNVMLGYQAGQSNSPAGQMQADNNTICLGNDSISNLFCNDTSISSSDSRDKADITNFTPGLAWIKAMRPVTYKWDKRSWYLGEDETDITAVTRDGSKKKSKVNVGFIAQEVLDIEKNNGFGDTEDKMLTVNLTSDGKRYGLKYERLVPVLVNAIKELSAEVETLKTKVATLEAA